MKILFAGCGDLGSRAGALLAAAHSCYGLRRQPQNLSGQIAPIAADMCSAEQMERVLAGGYDAVIATITPAKIPTSMLHRFVSSTTIATCIFYI